ncbi:MAG: caspase family protein [Cyanobacteria bacterium J06581_3]
MSPFDFEQSIAIVIGIDRYQNGIAPLRTAVSDASAIAQTLSTDHGYEVISLLDEQANLTALQDLIRTKLPNRLSPNSRLLLYFAGHGIAQDGEDGPAGYLIPQSAHPGKTETYLPMVALHDALTALPCRHFLAIFDCCFAGAFRWSSTRDISFTPEVIHQERYDRFRQDPAWQVITSASYDQKAMDILSLQDDRGQVSTQNSSEQHSPFAAALLNALKGDADAFPPAKDGQPAGDGVITATELYLYLRDSVEVLTEGQRKRQTPELCPLRNHDKGEFIFLTPGHELNLPPAPELNVHNNPYRGLESFDPEHSDLFFGRDEEVEQLLARLETPHPLTVVLGASGTGKSSLIKAGLIPQLTEHPEFKVLPVMRPGRNPLEALARSCTTLVPDSKEKGLIEQFEKDNNALVNIVGRWRRQNPDTKLLLVIDQTEELITQTTNPVDAFQFQTLIKRVMAEHWERLWIVATLRLDFESQFQDEALKEEWMDARFTIAPMGQAQLRAAIELPAATRVLTFEPHSLVDQLAEDVAQTPGALPLLSFTLSEMYLRYLDRRSDNRALTEADYRALGGVAGSLTNRATQEYNTLVAKDAAYAKTVKHVMLRMVAVEGGELARRRVPLSELIYRESAENERVQTLLQRLVAARLIVRGQDGDGSLASEPYVEPAHDALVRGWDKLLRWKNEEQEALALQRRLSPAAKEWTAKAKEKQAKGLLWNANPRLGLLREILVSEQNWLNKAESAFVESSFKLRRKNQRRFVGSLLGVVVSLSGLSLGLVKRNNELNISSKRNLAGRLAAEANNLMNKSSVKQQTGALLAVQAHQLLDEIGEESIEINQVLRRSLEVLPEATEIKHEDGVASAMYSPDGTKLATASKDGITRVWTVATTAPSPSEATTVANNQSDNSNPNTPNPLADSEALTFNHGDNIKVNAIGFSANSQHLATAGADNLVKIWDTTGAQQTPVSTIEHSSPVRFVSFSPATGNANQQWVVSASAEKVIVSVIDTGKQVFAFDSNDPITAVKFSPDGQRLAIANAAGKMSVRAVASNQNLFSVDSGSTINAVSFSPDGQSLAAAMNNRNATIFDLKSKKQQFVLAHASLVKDVSFSPDGKQIATASFDETARIWDAETGNELARFEHEDEVKTVTFSPTDSNYVATTSFNEAVQVWDIRAKQVSDTLSHESLVNVVSFHPTNRAQLATASDDNIAKVWNTTPTANAYQISHEGAVQTASFSPDGGEWVVTASNQTAGDKVRGTINVWKATDGSLVRSIVAQQGIRTLSLSENGTLIVTAGFDNIARVWNARTGEQVRELKHSDTILSVGLSPDAQKIATTSTDRKARIWDQTGNLVATLEHSAEVKSASFNSDGSLLVTASRDQTAGVWDVETEELVTELLHLGPVREAIFSPDDRYIVTTTLSDTRTASNNNSAYVWDWQAPSAQDQLIFRAMHQRAVTTARFSHDGSKLATGSRDRTAKIWDMATIEQNAKKEKPSALEAESSLNHRRGVNTVRFSQEDDRIVTASADGTARVWDVSTGKPIVGLRHEAEVNTASFSPDGVKIATASKDRSTKVGGTDSRAIAQEVCDRVGKNLTAGEWVRYIAPNEKDKVKVLLDYELVCDNNPIHPSVAKAGAGLAGEGEVRNAKQIFRRVLALSAAQEEPIDLDPSTAEIDQDVDAVTQKFCADYSLAKAIEEAKYGHMQAAIAYFKETLNHQPSRDLNPDTPSVETDPEAVAKEIYEKALTAFQFTKDEAQNVAARRAYVLESFTVEDEFDYNNFDKVSAIPDEYEGSDRETNSRSSNESRLQATASDRPGQAVSSATQNDTAAIDDFGDDFGNDFDIEEEDFAYEDALFEETDYDYDEIYWAEEAWIEESLYDDETYSAEPEPQEEFGNEEILTNTEDASAEEFGAEEYTEDYSPDEGPVESDYNSGDTAYPEEEIYTEEEYIEEDYSEPGSDSYYPPSDFEAPVPENGGSEQFLEEEYYEEEYYEDPYQE